MKLSPLLLARIMLALPVDPMRLEYDRGEIEGLTRILQDAQVEA